jgi:polysaccharide export outer membrane protein
MQYLKLFRQLFLLTFLVSLGGCFSSNPADINAYTMPKDVDVTADNYILQPPDEIEIHCSKVPEIHLQKQQIRPDGKVTFEALGEIHAAGKTPKELAQLLHEKILVLYALTGENPVNVQIVAYKSKVYYVLGHVFFPGPKEYTGRDTVLTALAKARPTNLAWEERIQIIRPSADKKSKPKIFELNFDRISAHGDTSSNVLLLEGDIIYVPPTVLAAIGLKVQELISPLFGAGPAVSVMQAF